MAATGRRFRVKKKQKRISTTLQLVYGAIALLVVGGMVYGVWYVTRLPAFTVTSIEVEGGETITHESVRAVVDDTLQGAHAFLIPRRFVYFYPHEDIVAALEQVPRIRDVHVDIKNRTTLTVTFSEYIPHALWCTSLEGESCTFITDEGYAFAEAPPLRGGTFIRHIIIDREPERGVEAFSETDIRRIDALIESFENELNLRTYAVVRTSAGDEEYHLVNGGHILVAPTMSVQDTFDNLQSVLQSAEFAHITSGGFNYIDLRFGNRVFVRETMEDTQVATSTATTTDETSAVSELDTAED